MPLYEYECESCGTRFEVIQKFADPSVDVCRECGGVVRRLLSAPAIQFKGTGWYITDYARKGKVDPGAPGTAPAAAKSGEPGGGGEKAPAASDAGTATPAGPPSTAGGGSAKKD